MRPFNTTSILLTLLFAAPILYTQNLDWVSVNPYPQDNFYSIKFFDQNTGFVVGSGGVILKNITGSNLWIRQQSTVKTDLYGMYFFDINHGFVCGANGVLLSTTNSGTTWTRVALTTSKSLTSITFKDANTGFVVGDSGTFLKSTNGGISWTLTSANAQRLNCIYFYNSNSGYVCGDSGTFFRTTDGGSTWFTQNLGQTNLTCVNFANSLNGVITSRGAYINSPAYFTSNGGVNWNTISFFRIGNNWGTVRFRNQDTGIIAGKDNLIMRTTNGGQGWLENSLPQSTFINDISFVDTAIFVCGTNGIIYEYSLGGYFKNLGGSRENLSFISFTDANNGLISTSFLDYRTTNGGASWSITPSGWYGWEEGCADYTTYMKLFTSTSGFKVTIAYNCHGGYSFYDMRQTTDGGSTWNGSKGFFQTNTGIYGLCEAEGVSFVIAMTGGAVIYKNSGSGWVSIGTVSNPAGMSFPNQNTGIVIGGLSTQRSYMRTTDGGISWITTQTGTTKFMSCINMLASGYGIIGGDSGFVMITNNFGANWTVLPSAGAFNITNIFFANNTTGWFTSRSFSYPYAKRLFYSNNGGTNFQQLQSLMNFNVNGFSFVDANTGYVCGDSGVVLKTTNGGITFVNPSTENLPKEFSLSQNYPNPFNPSTTIAFSIPPLKGVRGMTDIKLIIFDITGREVATLINHQMQPGNYSVDWDASNFPSGVYFYQLSINNEQFASKKMVLIK